MEELLLVCYIILHILLGIGIIALAYTKLIHTDWAAGYVARNYEPGTLAAEFEEVRKTLHDLLTELGVFKIYGWLAVKLIRHK
jgi:hypothetical protein